MIKKAVLPILLAPFLMVFSVDSFAYWATVGIVKTESSVRYMLEVNSCYTINKCYSVASSDPYSSPDTKLVFLWKGSDPIPDSDYIEYNITNTVYTDEQCAEKFSGESVPVSASSANYLTSGGSAFTGGGVCSVSGAGGVMACSGDPVECVLDLEATSTGEKFDINVVNADLKAGGDGTFSVMEFTSPDYLNELPGGCTDSSSCVQIGDKSYLVDWDSAPDYFEYVDSDGNVHSKPSSGGGNTGGGDPSDPTDPTDPGGDTGGGDTGGGDDFGNDDSDDSSGGGGSGGGSTVPDFEFDESGIIEAIRSSGQSNRNSIDALSNDVTREINDQTNDLNAATTAQTEALNSTINDQTAELVTQGDRQTGRVTTAITSQTQSIQNTLDGQTRSLNSTLGDLQKAIVDGMKNIKVRFSGGGKRGSGGEPNGEGESEGDGEEEGFLDTLIDKLASLFDAKFDQAANSSDIPSAGDTAGMIDGEGAGNNVMQSLEEGIEEKNTAIYDDFKGVFDGGGVIDGTLTPLRDFVTSFLPSLPTGGCTPLTFGAGERSFTIDCEGFNLLKAALSWVLFFFTAYQLISIPMDTRKSQ